MYYDALTAAAVADELRANVVGGRIQEVIHFDELTLGLEIYAQHQRHYLVASADARQARVHLTGIKLRRGVDTQVPLLLLLRKRARGGRIAGVRQPPFERILHLDISGPEETVTLTIEAMGRHSNIILIDADGQVLDSIKRISARLSRVRPMLPGTRYELPPPQQKLDPADVTERALGEMVDSARAGQPVWRALVNGIRGMSPLLAREIVYRAAGTIDEPCGDVMQVAPYLDAYNVLLEHAWDRRWEPCVAREEGEVTVYAPYPLTHYAKWEPVTTISEAIDRYEQAVQSADAYGPARAGVQAPLDDARERVRTRLEALKRQLIPQEELDRLRLSGEMILSYAHAIHRGQTEAEVQADLEGPPMRIALDPVKTAVENAQAYFERYEKAKAASAEIPALLRKTRYELAYLDQLETDLELASNRPEIDEVRSALIEAGYAARRRGGSRSPPGQPLRVTSPDGLLILVGRSARQNHEVTFRQGAPDDLWLHAVDVPGAHVIVKSGGGEVPRATIERAAELAAYYSAVRGETRVLVAYTRRRYVRQIRGAGPGMVTYRNEGTIAVSPRGSGNP
jgi:predicted ribosome quality control (RQC) complex YloA/Tae2 family protein